MLLWYVGDGSLLVLRTAHLIVVAPLNAPSSPCLPACSAPSAFHSFAAHLSTQLFLLGDAAEAVAGAVGGDAAAQAVADAVSQGGDAAVEVC